MKETKKLYDSISNIDDRFIEEAQAEELRKAPVWRKWTALAACLCIVAVSVVTVIHPWETGGTPVPNPNGVIERDPEPNRFPSTNIVPVQPDDDDQPGAEPLEPPAEPIITINWDGVLVNESEGQSPDAPLLYYDPEIYLSESWEEEDVVAYYGWNLMPTYVPEGLTEDGQGDSTEIWREKATGEIVRDQAGRDFWTDFWEDESPIFDGELYIPTGFLIRASKLGILRCGILPVDEARTTDFGGVSVTISHCSMKLGPFDPTQKAPDGLSNMPAGYYDIYTASFTLNGVEYEIEARRLELEEVIKIVASIINVPYSEDFTVGNS